MIRNVLALVMLLTLALALWSLWRQLDVPVRSVRVEGTLSPAEQGAIRDVVVQSLDRGILSLDADELRARIRDLSWPRAVAVRRVWPDALVIRVEKESVVASWGDGGYLTSAGKVVQLAGGAERVPALDVSLSPPRRAMEVYQMLESRVNPAGFSIVELEENRLGEWLMTFEGGMTVALGNEHLRERLERFLLAYQRAFAARAQAIEHVDLRYDDGLAVRWSDEPAIDAVGAVSRPRLREPEESRSGDRSPTGGSHEKNSLKPGLDYALR